MELGDFLVLAGLIKVEQLDDALAQQAERGGSLGYHLVALGHMTEEALAPVLRKFPAELRNVEATGIDETELLGLMMKQIHTYRLRSTSDFAEAIKLPPPVVATLVRVAVEQKLLYAKGVRADNSAIMTYDLTDEGRRWAMEALSRSQYNGPAPVTLERYTQQIGLQKITSEGVTAQQVRRSLGDLELEDALLEQAGPALNTGRALLLYGPPGNGKTTVALRLASVFRNIIFVPYAVEVEGQIIRVFDPSVHVPIEIPEGGVSQLPSMLRREELDARWVPCKRPFVVAGGELTLEMLDLRYDPVSKLYEAPLHMKALGGCFVIDDFGRQLVSPANLLNRWIVPLESRKDYLKLHTGKSFDIPFDELVIFSTNLEPADLMDPAFLRRLPYKIEIGAPSVEHFKRILKKECTANGIPFDDDKLERIVHSITVEKQLELAAFQPRFILEQVVASCRYAEVPPELVPRFLQYALDNLRVGNSHSA